jgi:competence protein ComEA
MSKIKILDKYRVYIIGFLILVVGFGFYLIYNQPEEERVSKEKKELVVDISGAVKKPGVYTFNEQDRVIDAINKAGGINKKANLELIAQDINQASFLEDEQKIFIPPKDEGLPSNVASIQTESSAGNSNVSTQGVVNINSASTAELESLPGIGQVYAQRIIDLRKKIGRFTSPNQLLEVSGIGERTLEKIVPHISL